LIGPSWVSYEPCAAFAGGKIEWSQVDEDFMPIDVADTITRKTRFILVNSPSNPTGAVFDLKILEEIRDLAVDHDLFVVSDEIYEKIIYDREHISIGSLREWRTGPSQLTIFQGLRHDRLAVGLFDRSERDHEMGHQASLTFGLTGYYFRSKGRSRGIEGATKCRGCHGGRVQY